MLYSKPEKQQRKNHKGSGWGLITMREELRVAVVRQVLVSSPG